MPPRKLRRHRGSIAGAFVLVLWGVFWSGSGAAGDPPASFALAYEVDSGLSGCPSESDFRRAIGNRLGYDPFGTAPLHRVVARVHPSPNGILGELEWTDARRGTQEGTRQLSPVARDCRQLVRDMAFVLAVHIQLLADHPPPESGPSPPPASSSGASFTDAGPAEPGIEASRPDEVNATPSGPSAKDSPAAAAVAPTSTQITPPEALPEESHDASTKTGAERPIPGSTVVRTETLGVGLTTTFGFEPDWSAGGEIIGSVQWNRISLELSFEGSLPVTFRQSDGSGFSISMYRANVAPCGHLEAFALCALATVGVAQIEGVGVDVSRTSGALTARTGLRAWFKQPVSDRLALAIHADGLFDLIPHTVYVNELPVWSTFLFGGAVGADVEMIFR